LDSIMKIIKDEDYKFNNYMRQYEFNINLLSNTIDLKSHYA